MMTYRTEKEYYDALNQDARLTEESEKLVEKWIDEEDNHGLTLEEYEVLIEKASGEILERAYNYVVDKKKERESLEKLKSNETLDDYIDDWFKDMEERYRDE